MNDEIKRFIQPYAYHLCHTLPQVPKRRDAALRAAGSEASFFSLFAADPTDWKRTGYHWALELKGVPLGFSATAASQQRIKEAN